MYPSRFGLGYVTWLSQQARAEQLRREQDAHGRKAQADADSAAAVQRRAGIVGLIMAGILIASLSLPALVA